MNERLTFYLFALVFSTLLTWGAYVLGHVYP